MSNSRRLPIALALGLVLFAATGHAVGASPNQQADAPKDPADTAPPNPVKACWKSDKDDPEEVSGPASAPVPFLYQPFRHEFDPNDDWSSQMDHLSPDYGEDGQVATLGEQLRFNTRSASGLYGGTSAWCRTTDEKGAVRNYSAYFPHKEGRTLGQLLRLGCYLFAYESPAIEMPLYYDGHDGNDYAVSGDALAAGDGVVAFAGNRSNSLGNYVDIYHANGFLTRYAHLAGYDVEKDDPVEPGEKIGVIGGTPNWSRHLHFQVYRWNSDREEWAVTDPYSWDPWLPPAEQANRDPLVACNGEVSYNLWVEGWPTSADGGKEAQADRPTNGRYVGGWLGEYPAVPHPAPPAGVIPVDDLSGGFFREGPPGDWRESDGGFGDHSYWTYSTDAPARAEGRWRLAVPSAGTYEAYAFIPDSHSTATGVVYRLTGTERETSVEIDQSAHAGSWVKLGVFKARGSETPVLSLSDVTGDPGGTTQLAFDAAGFRSVNGSGTSIGERLQAWLGELAAAVGDALKDALDEAAKAAGELARQLVKELQDLARRAGDRAKGAVVDRLEQGAPQDPASAVAKYFEAVDQLDAGAAAASFRPADRIAMRLLHSTTFAVIEAAGADIGFSGLSFSVQAQDENEAEVHVTGEMALHATVGDTPYSETTGVDLRLHVQREGDKWYLKGSDELNEIVQELVRMIESL